MAKGRKRTSRKETASNPSRRRPLVAAAAPSSSVPPPLAGVPRAEVGATVQRFIDFDGVRSIRADEEPPGTTFTITPLA